jgi:hypothetical protein
LDLPPLPITKPRQEGESLERLQEVAVVTDTAPSTTVGAFAIEGMEILEEAIGRSPVSRVISCIYPSISMHFRIDKKTR